MKKNNKNKIDIRLFIFRNIKKTFKYYFKNIFYIIFTNLIGFIIINTFIKMPYTFFVIKYFSHPVLFNIFYYGFFIIIFSTIKIILYGNSTYTMKQNSVNDVKDLIFVTFKRFLPVLGVFLIYIIVVLFLSLLLIVPGILFFFYYYLSVFLCAIGDINIKETNSIKILNGGKALARSYNLVKGNLIRLSLLTCIMGGITYMMDLSLIKIFLKLNFSLNNITYDIARFCVFDFMIIYSILIFIKLESIENDRMEEEFKKNLEEQAMLNKAAVNNFSSSK